MTECDNSKIHISSNFILSISLLIMFDTLLLSPSLHCNTSLHFTTLHHTSPNYTSLHFLSFTLHYPLIQLYSFTFPIVLFHLTSLNQTQYSSHLELTNSVGKRPQTYALDCSATGTGNGILQVMYIFTELISIFS